MRTGQLLSVFAGEHPRGDCPVWFAAPTTPAEASLWLVDVETGGRTPSQRIGDRVVVILDALSRGEERTFRLEAGEPAMIGVAVVDHDAVLDVSISGAPFTSYHYGIDHVRPYFFPLFGPTGVAMTRNYPMVAGVPGESTDHPHHRSLYVAFGEVNGVDVWSEPPHPITGRIVHQGWDELSAGPVAAHWIERLFWVDGRDLPLLDERRVVTAYRTTSVWLLDLDITLTPARVAVLFADTKEGGPLALRVASAIEGKRGGLIQNAYGARREDETWGKRAPWVDYSGSIDGGIVGVALMDHPTSFRHPTWWHVRDYGLFAANPFGTSAFTGDPANRGDHVLVPGQSLSFRYRICLHQGDAEDGGIADRYQDYANPPRARWQTE